MALGEIARGHVNADGAVNLLDAVLTLRLLSGLATPNQDIAAYMAGKQVLSDKLGLPDTLMILQKIADLR